MKNFIKNLITDKNKTLKKHSLNTAGREFYEHFTVNKKIIDYPNVFENIYKKNIYEENENTC